MSNRKIDVAVLVENEIRKVIDVNYVLRGKKGFKYREKYNSDEITFECCECSEQLTISYVNGTVYLKHFPNSEDCILKESSISQN